MIIDSGKGNAPIIDMGNLGRGNSSIPKQYKKNSMAAADAAEAEMEAENARNGVVPKAEKKKRLTKMSAKKESV